MNGKAFRFFDEGITMTSFKLRTGSAFSARTSRDQLMREIGEGVSYVTSADERQRLARLRYFRRDNPSAAERFAAVAATRFRTGTGGRAVAGITAKLDMIVPGLRSVPPHPEAETVMVGGVGPSRNAPESTRCRSYKSPRLPPRDRPAVAFCRCW